MKSLAGLILTLLLPLSGFAAGEAKVVALGASQTHGKGVARADAYPAQLERALRAEGIAVTVVNEGVDGENTNDIAARLDRAVPEGTRVVILQPGTNDRAAKSRRGAVGADDTLENVEAMLAKLRDRGVKVVLLGYPGGGGGPIAKKHGAVWYGQPRKDLDDRYLQADGQHLTPEGYAILAKNLAGVVKPLLVK